MRRILLKAHLCLGLAAALFLVLLGITGSVMAFENEFNRLVNPSLLTVTAGPDHLPWEDLRRSVEAAEPGWRVQRIYLPEQDNQSTYVRLESRASGKTDEIYVDQHNGRILGRKSAGTQIIWKIHDLHVNLAAGYAGSQVVAASSIVLALLAVSGLILWWPRKIFSFRPRASFPRVTNDLHRSLGFWSSSVMLLFAITGVNLHIQTGGTLFDIMEDKSRAVSHAGYGTTADGIIRAAGKAVPGARVMRVSFWPGKRPILVQLRFPEDHTPAGRTSVTLDPKTGRVLKVVSSRTAPWYYTALVQWNREIHTGTMFGTASRALMMVFSFLLSVLALSGVMIWAVRQLARHRGRQAAAARLRERQHAVV